MENYRKLVSLRIETSDENLSDLSLNSVSFRSFIEQDPASRSVDREISSHFGLPIGDPIDARTADVTLAGLRKVDVVSLQQLRDSLLNADQVQEFLISSIAEYKKAGIQVNFNTVNQGMGVHQLMIYLLSKKGENFLMDFYTQMNGYEHVRQQVASIHTKIAGEISQRTART